MVEILIVDDNINNIKVLASILRKLDANIEYALDGYEAMELIEEISFDIILMDQMMPGIDGYTTCQRIKKMEHTKDIPIIFVTALHDSESVKKAFDLGAVDYITKPLKEYEVLARVKTHLKLKQATDMLIQDNTQLEEVVKVRTMELKKTQAAVIQSLASLMERRDNETGSHIFRTKEYVRILAKELSNYDKYKNVLNCDTIDLIASSAVLHDIGKVGISDSILFKPDRLTKAEFEKMKMHTVYGYETLIEAKRVIGKDTFLENACDIAYYHHEKWNGEGYPVGLVGADIPLSAQMMAVADVYDAIVTKRVYKEAQSHITAVKIIQGEKGEHFAPDVVEAFLKNQDEFWEIAYNQADTEEERIIIGDYQKLYS